jgi:probable HAF family extracellular repeat protein
MKTSLGRKSTVLVLMLFFGLAGGAPSSGQEAGYTLYELGTLGGPNTYAYDINDSGQIVGAGEKTPHAYGWVAQAFIGTKEGIAELFPGEEGESSAKAINREGTVAGHKNGRAFIIGGGSPFVDLGPLPGASHSAGLSINRAKKVAGFSWNQGVFEKGSLWAGDGSGNYLNSEIVAFGGAYARALSLNDADEVVGYGQTVAGYNRAFRWKAGAADPLEELGVLPGFEESFANRINSRGWAVGYSLKYEGYFPAARACLWGPNGLQELKRKNQAGVSESVSYSEAYGINDSGWVVGMFYSAEHGQFRAFVWDPANEMRDLNALLPENAGMILVAAQAINGRGEIVGYGQKPGSENAVAFVLIPPAQPEPDPDPGPEPADGPFAFDIDIRPWNPQNKINLHARWGLIPVAILSTEDFNAPEEVNRRSLTFGQTGEENSLAFCAPWKWDVNRDRRKDLVCYFYEKAANFKCGDNLGTLLGETVDGDLFGGQDKIQMVPCPPLKKKYLYRGR